MILSFQLLLVSIAVIGHLALCVASYNRFHSTPIHHRLIKLIDVPHGIAAIAWPAWLIWKFVQQPAHLKAFTAFWSEHWIAGGYAMLCLAFAGWVGAMWLARSIARADRGALLANDTIELDVARETGCRPARVLASRICSLVPGNEMFRLSIHVKRIRMKELPPELEGLTIAHLSDFHLCGKIGPEYFEYVVERANALEADLVAITGDILEKEPCYEWLPRTVGRLRAPHGVYFVLGNHDKRVADVRRLRGVLYELGLKDVGQSPRSVRVRGAELILCGNELPWFGPPSIPPPGTDHNAFRLLLSHSPDQLPWARQHGFRLMLAGHTHGGQIRFPGIGAVVCPSRFGVKYACGTFLEPPTLLHVSRGISGLDLVRLNCPPELTKLVLVGPNESAEKR